MDITPFRGLILLFPMLAVGAAIVHKQPGFRKSAASVLATLWCIPALLIVHLAATRFGWWIYQPTQADLLGMPADLLFAWALGWGALPAIAWTDANLAVVVLVALGFDLVYMPQLAPFVVLGPNWWLGEAASIALVLVPAQLFARWTLWQSNLRARASMQCVTFTGLLFILLPATVLQSIGKPWPDLPSQLKLTLWFLPALIGISALQEFVQRGRGTPVPFDPPAILVRSGIYSYVRNPMQLAISLLLPAVFCHLLGWIGIVGFVLAVAYSQGIALWDEQIDLTARFGSGWKAYAGSVPRWFPLHKPKIAPAHLFVDAECKQCRELGSAIARLRPSNLQIAPATRALQRITYTGTDGYSVSGVAAVARALEHVHFGWALLGMTMRLPLLGSLIQMVSDVSGGDPRQK
jgi:protein-S-isoprenylcysteine O-methyltransferase Ste14